MKPYSHFRCPPFADHQWSVLPYLRYITFAVNTTLLNKTKRTEPRYSMTSGAAFSRSEADRTWSRPSGRFRMFMEAFCAARPTSTVHSHLIVAQLPEYCPSRDSRLLRVVVTMFGLWRLRFAYFFRCRKIFLTLSLTSYNYFTVNPPSISPSKYEGHQKLLGCSEIIRLEQLYCIKYSIYKIPTCTFCALLSLRSVYKRHFNTIRIR
jgi:hypothetical protein